MLSQSGARQLLWREVVVDFGHELITAVHTPIAWSDQRPSDAEFRKSFAATRLSASRILRFIEDRRCCVQRVVLKNSEGYFSGGAPLLTFMCSADSLAVMHGWEKLCLHSSPSPAVLSLGNLHAEYTLGT